MKQFIYLFNIYVIIWIQQRNPLRWYDYKLRLLCLEWETNWIFLFLCFCFIFWLPCYCWPAGWYIPCLCVTVFVTTYITALCVNLCRFPVSCPFWNEHNEPRTNPKKPLLVLLCYVATMSIFPFPFHFDMQCLFGWYLHEKLYAISSKLITTSKHHFIFHFLSFQLNQHNDHHDTDDDKSSPLEM